MTKNDVYQAVTDKILGALDRGIIPWRKPWTSRHSMPVSLSTGKAYRGVNVWLLAMEGRSDPRWGTYRAIKAAGGQVRKGEKGTKIILWKPVRKTFEDAETGEETSGGYLLLREYVVFNAEQADGLPELDREERNEHEQLERAEQVVKGYKMAPAIFHGSPTAHYEPLTDRVRMPDPEDFTSSPEYYQTLFHELIHSTGHESRLDRLEPALFGTDPYAREELVAEIGASMLAGLAELETAAAENSQAYVQNWARRFREDPKLIVNAAAQAQKAADRILGETFEGETFAPIAEEPVSLAA